jgi:predicted amino acid dehydrogenase
MNSFAFIIHPLEVADLARKYKVAAYLPRRVVEWATKRIPAKALSHITGIRSSVGTEIEGWFVGCGLMPRQFLELDEEFVIQKVVEAGKVAESLGAMILGLGAFTAIVGEGGKAIAERLSIPVTTGNSYTVATAVEATFLGAEKMGIDVSACKAAVVGATGSIGRVCSLILAERVPRLSLVARNRAKLEALAEEVQQGKNGRLEVELRTEVKDAIRDANLIISVSSSPDAIIFPEDLLPGAVVCDPARPRDTSAKVAEMRSDVLVVDGGVVEVPGEPEFGFDFGFPPRTAYACMAETMILAMEGRFEPFSLGKELEREKVEEIARLAQRHGFRLAGFRAFERAVEDEQIEAIRDNARKALARGKLS